MRKTMIVWTGLAAAGALTAAAELPNDAATAVPACVDAMTGAGVDAARQALADATPHPGLAKRVTVRLNKAPFVEVLDEIGRQSGLSFFVTEEFEKTQVSVDVKNMPVADLLAVLTEPKGLIHRRGGKSDSFMIVKRP